MSYILEALKRADAERQRGGVPGLHAQTGSGVTAVEPGDAGGRPWLLAGAALALLLIGAAVVWWWRAGPVAAPVVPPTAAAAAVLPAPAVAPGAAALAAPTPAPLALPGLAARQPPASRPAPPLTATAAAATAAVVAATLTTAAPAAPAMAPLALPGSVARPPGSASATLATTAPASAAAAPVAAVPERLLQLGELPDALRRELGPLNPGGSIYAEQASARMVILNGQVFREGDLLAAQLRVELIRPRSVVLSLRGQRFELAL